MSVVTWGYVGMAVLAVLTVGLWVWAYRDAKRIDRALAMHRRMR
jgi:cbb3-type cytochrome oxidase subunit 3